MLIAWLTGARHAECAPGNLLLVNHAVIILVAGPAPGWQNKSVKLVACHAALMFI